MRKLILFILLFSIKIKAQTYFKFPDSNAVWTESLGFVAKYAVKGDSLYNTLTYKKYYIVNDTNLSIATYNYFAMVRQDITSKKVYAIKGGTTYERLLYNFNLSVNDSVRVTPLDFGYPGTTGYNSNGYKLKVIAKDSVLLNSQYRKRLKLDCYPNGWGWTNPEYWIEGIGSTFGIFGAGLSGYIITDVCFPILLCQKQNGVLNYLNPTYNSCFAIPCTVGLNELITNNVVLKIVPNPTTDNVNLTLENIKFTFKMESLQCSIINTFGQIVQTTNIQNQTTALNISNLQNGIYFLKVFDKNKLIGTTKIIKQ